MLQRYRQLSRIPNYKAWRASLLWFHNTLRAKVLQIRTKRDGTSINCLHRPIIYIETNSTVFLPNKYNKLKKETVEIIIDLHRLQTWVGRFSVSPYHWVRQTHTDGESFNAPSKIDTYVHINYVSSYKDWYWRYQSPLPLPFHHKRNRLHRQSVQRKHPHSRWEGLHRIW